MSAFFSQLRPPTPQGFGSQVRPPTPIGLSGGVVDSANSRSRDFGRAREDPGNIRTRGQGFDTATPFSNQVPGDRRGLPGQGANTSGLPQFQQTDFQGLTDSFFQGLNQTFGSSSGGSPFGLPTFSAQRQQQGQSGPFGFDQGTQDLFRQGIQSQLLQNFLPFLGAGQAGDLFTQITGLNIPGGVGGSQIQPDQFSRLAAGI